MTKRRIANNSAAATSANLRSLCEDIVKLDDAHIAGALATRNGKLLATSIGSGAPLPSKEYISKLIMEAQVMVGIPLANESVFGKFNFTLVSQEHLDSLLFYLKGHNAILGLGLLPGYDKERLLSELRDFLTRIDADQI